MCELVNKSQIYFNYWEIESTAIDEQLFDVALFNNFGGDTDLLLTKCKMSHVLRIFGNNINNKLVELSESTEIGKISGFIFKSEFLNKSRKNQFLFVNNRYIKSSNLNHSIVRLASCSIDPGLVKVGIVLA